MALNDDAVVYPNTAHFFFDPTGVAARPTLAQLVAYVGDTTTPITGFTNIGHTTLDNILAFDSDGGDTSVKGSLQNKSLREVVTSEAIDFFTVNSMQLKDNQVLQMYYGGGDVSVADVFGTPDVPVNLTGTFLAVVFDDNGPLGLYAKKTSVRRGDNLNFPNDDFASAPLRFTPLKVTGTPKMQWIGEGLGAAA